MITATTSKQKNPRDRWDGSAGYLKRCPTAVFLCLTDDERPLSDFQGIKFMGGKNEKNT